MKRTFVLFAKKAMVYALTAAMLLATPLTASAAEADDSGAFGDYDYVYDPLKPGTSEDPTGTITNTNTDTKVLDDVRKLEISGIYLTPTSVDMVKGEESWNIPLKATIVMNGEWEDLTEDQRRKIQGMIRWSTSDYSVVTIKPDENDRRVVYLCGRGCGTAKVTCKIVNVADGDRSYVDKNFRGDYSGTFMEASATVNVKDYVKAGSKLTFALPDKLYVKQTYNMRNFLRINGQWYDLNDKLTWFVTDTAGKDSKAASIDSDGMLTIKKANEEIVVHVATELGVTGESAPKLTEAGVSANSVVINGTGITGKDTTIKVTSNDLEANAITVSAVMSAKESKNDGAVTDKVTWTVKKTKTSIVELTPSDSLTQNSNSQWVSACKIKPVNVGKTTITATTTSGKKATLNVTVTAPLQTLTINNAAKQAVYTGQVVPIEVTRYPAINADKLNYSIAIYSSDDLKKAVSVDKNGNLKATKPGTGNVTVKVDNASKTIKENEKDYASGTNTFVIKSPDVKRITVYDFADLKEEKTVVAQVDSSVKADTKTSTQTVDINKSAKFYAVANKGAQSADSLQWTSSSTKVATVDNDGLVKALKAGTATIKVSGTYIDNGKAKTITAQFKVTVMQPAESVKLNKSLVIVNPGVKKDVSVAFTASVTPSNSDKDFTWDLQGKPHEEIKVTPNAKKTSAATVTITKDVANDKSMLGKDFDVIAMNKRSGAYATAKIQMVNQTKQVVLTKNGTVETALSGKKYKVTNAITNITPDLEVGKSEKVYACVYFGDPTVSTADEKNYRLASDPTVEDVTWTIAKAGVGYVNVIDNGDGSFSIYGLRPTKSAVTITFTTASKKKVNVKVKVVAPAS